MPIYYLTIDHAYEGEQQEGFSGTAEELRTHIGEIASKTPLKGFGVIAEDEAGEIVYRTEI